MIMTTAELRGPRAIIISVPAGVAIDSQQRKRKKKNQQPKEKLSEIDGDIVSSRVVNSSTLLLVRSGLT